MGNSLHIRLSDLYRATLASDCGNEGFIGIAPDFSRYHVVVPVDRQIARGLKFWMPPDDGTPFGGYQGWHYFCCPTYDRATASDKEEGEMRLGQAHRNGWLLRKWGEGLGVSIALIEDM